MMLQTEIPPGPFTVAMAMSTGVPRYRLDEWVANGLVRRVLQGVYQRVDVPDTTLTRARAAFLVIKPFTVLCDRTAAWIHGVDTFDFRELEILPRLESWVLRDRARIRRGGCVGGRRDLSAADIMHVDGVCVTTPLRTALDLGSRLNRRDALAALDGFMRVHGLTIADFRAELPRFRRRRGVVQLRSLIPLADGRAESPGESWTRLCIIDDGLPAPEPQSWVTDDDGYPIFRLDLPYPKHKVVVEYDGAEFHTTPEQRAHDAARRDWLRRHGWTVIVVRKESFEQHARQAWLAELRSALRLAEARNR
jgi:hypothetical protein